MYIIDFEKLKELSSFASNVENKESEIIETYGNEDYESNDGISLISKTQREVKHYGDSESEAMLFEVVRMLIEKLMSSNSKDWHDMTYAESIAFCTLKHNKIIIEIE